MYCYNIDSSSDTFSDSEEENINVIIEINNLEFEDKYFTDLEKVNFYKKKLELEPEFVGLKNISGAILFTIINSINKDTVMDVRKTLLTNNTSLILDDLFYELYGEIVDDYYKKITVKKIYNKCYC